MYHDTGRVNHSYTCTSIVCDVCHKYSTGIRYMYIEAVHNYNYFVFRTMSNLQPTTLLTDATV